MLPSNKPIFPIAGNFGGVKINAANIATDGSGTVGTDLFLVAQSLAGGAGTIVSGIVFISCQPTHTLSAARVCRVFITKDDGSSPGIVGEVALPAVTRSHTVIGATATFWFPKPVVLRPGQKILVSQSIRDTSNDDTFAYALAGDYNTPTL